MKCNKTDISATSENTVYIDNLYYDTVLYEFVVNDINRNKLNRIKWHGRDCPREVGKNIAYREINEETYELTLGENDGKERVVCLARRYSPHNYGHLLCETGIPIEYICKQNNIINRSDRVILLDDDSEEMESIYWFEGYDADKIRQCNMHSTNIFIPMADTVIFNFKKYISNINYNGMRYIKIKNRVLFGIGNISPWDNNGLWSGTMMSDVLEEYVKKVYESNNKDINREKNVITFVKKRGRRSVLNDREIAELLKRVGNENGLLYEEFNLEDICYDHQLEILSKTKLLITNGGSSAFCSFLLPKKTNMLYFPIYGNNFEYYLFSKFNNKFNLFYYELYDKNWYSNIKTLDQSYDVNIQIVERILHEMLHH